MPESTKDVVHAYYAAWAARDKEAATALMADDMHHISIYGVWESAQDYLTEFERLSKGLADIRFMREVYADGDAFVLFRVVMESGASFIGTDLLSVSDGQVDEIINVNSGDPTALVELPL